MVIEENVVVVVVKCEQSESNGAIGNHPLVDTRPDQSGLSSGGIPGPSQFSSDGFTGGDYCTPYSYCSPT